MNNSLLDT